MWDAAKFNCYDRVVSKQTGLPGVGRVAGVCNAVAYFNNISAANPKLSFRRWDELYSDWIDKYVYYVYYDKPRKTLSKEELSVHYDREWDEELEEVYNKLPEYHMAVYVEDDLELFG